MGGISGISILEARHNTISTSQEWEGFLWVGAGSEGLVPTETLSKLYPVCMEPERRHAARGLQSKYHAIE